jgi:hypothetical protein
MFAASVLQHERRGLRCTASRCEERLCPHCDGGFSVHCAGNQFRVIEAQTELAEAGARVALRVDLRGLVARDGKVVEAVAWARRFQRADVQMGRTAQPRSTVGVRLTRRGRVADCPHRPAREKRAGPAQPKPEGRVARLADDDAGLGRSQRSSHGRSRGLTPDSTHNRNSQTTLHRSACAIVVKRGPAHPSAVGGRNSARSSRDRMPHQCTRMGWNCDRYAAPTGLHAAAGSCAAGS